MLFPLWATQLCSRKWMVGEELRLICKDPGMLAMSGSVWRMPRELRKYFQSNTRTEISELENMHSEIDVWSTFTEYHIFTRFRCSAHCEPKNSGSCKICVPQAGMLVIGHILLHWSSGKIHIKLWLFDKLHWHLSKNKQTQPRINNYIFLKRHAMIFFFIE